MITAFDYDPSVGFEPISDEILTEPGLAMDIPTMLRRFSQGTLSGVSQRQPVYDDEDVPDPTLSPDFDLTDADMYLRSISERIERERAEIRAKKQQSVEKPVEKPVGNSVDETIPHGAPSEV